MITQCKSDLFKRWQSARWVLIVHFILSSFSGVSEFLRCTHLESAHRYKILWRQSQHFSSHFPEKFGPNVRIDHRFRFFFCTGSSGRPKCQWHRLRSRCRWSWAVGSVVARGKKLRGRDTGSVIRQVFSRNFQEYSVLTELYSSIFRLRVNIKFIFEHNYQCSDFTFMEHVPSDSARWWRCRRRGHAHRLSQMRCSCWNNRWCRFDWRNRYNDRFLTRCRCKWGDGRDGHFGGDGDFGGRFGCGFGCRRGRCRWCRVEGARGYRWCYSGIFSEISEIFLTHFLGMKAETALSHNVCCMSSHFHRNFTEFSSKFHLRPYLWLRHLTL